MAEILSLKLISSVRNEEILGLHEYDISNQLESVLTATAKVYSDSQYNIEIAGIDSSEILEVQVRLNGEEADSFYRDGVINLQGYPFQDILGFVQIGLDVTYQDGAKREYYSDFASVMVQKSYLSDNIAKMLKYIYDNQIEFLYRNTEGSKIAESVSSVSYDDLLSRISMLEEISMVYEYCYGYFKANSRFKLKSVYAVERVEKLQNIGARTIQYMVQHPEHMKKEYSGIRFGKQSYLPDKTLMSINQVTTDIYENQVIVAFLAKALNDTEELYNQIKLYLSLVEREEKDDDYVLSSYLLFMNAVGRLKEAQKRLDILHSKLQELHIQYKRTLQVTEVDLKNPPKPTQIFLSEPQYNRIFLCIMNWFSSNGFESGAERFMVNFYNSSLIYEFYTLLKILDSIKAMGFDINTSRRVCYPESYWSNSRNDVYNNFYEFKRDSSTITVYYQPMILDTDRRDIANIELYRNNSVSFSDAGLGQYTGTYYLPDYILKYQDGDYIKYIICDAKFSSQHTIRFHYIPKLTYKYLTSISTLPIEDKHISVLGMAVFYGKCWGSEGKTSFYDNALGEEIVPFVDMFPLSEMMDHEKQTEELEQLISKLCSA